MEKIGTGIIGFGRIGAEHAGWLSRASNVQAVAVADATPARQAIAEQRGLTVYPEMDAMLGDARVDAVLVATPTAMHFEHTMRALAAGKHVLVEKPMAIDLQQSRQMVARAKQEGLVLSVFHNRRWDIDYLTVREAIDSGAFGKVINVESCLGQFASCVGPAAKEYRPGWRNEANFGGGVLFDWGSHFVDQIWRLFHPQAKVTRVYAQLRGNLWSTDCDDFARVLFDFDNGAVAMVETNTTTTSPAPRWHIDGTTGSADSPFSLTFDTHAWAQLRFTPGDPAATPAVFPLAKPGLTETQIWEHFAAAVRGEAEPAVSAESVLTTMALLDAARQSSREGRAVAIAGGAARTNEGNQR